MLYHFSSARKLSIITFEVHSFYFIFTQSRLSINHVNIKNETFTKTANY